MTLEDPDVQIIFLGLLEEGMIDLLGNILARDGEL